MLREPPPPQRSPCSPHGCAQITARDQLPVSQQAPPRGVSSEGQLQGPNTSTLHGPSQVAGVYPPTLDRWDLGPRTPPPSLKAEFLPFSPVPTSSFLSLDKYQVRQPLGTGPRWGCETLGGCQ